MDEDIPMLVPQEQNISSTSMRTAPVPVTIITGFLGSGKTTLIMRLLNDNTHNKKIAVILNEFGSSSGIDKSLSLKDGKITEEWLELANGCFCCSIKDSGVKAIENLLKRNKSFDYVLLETTGLADPGPIASMFWLDEALQSELYLDGIVTVVDAKNISNYLDETKVGLNEATKQIALADRIILNKIDLVDQNTLSSLKTRISAINSVAKIAETVQSKADIDFIFDLHSFDHHHKDPFEKENSVQLEHAIETVKTVAFTVNGVVESKKLDEWLQKLLWEKSIDKEMEILRFKALINMGDHHKYIVQSVLELFDIQKGQEWGSEEKTNKLVFIGRHLNEEMLRKSFTECLEDL
ncbi:COBW domain-containing protein 1 [Boothiomyces sp. JEL0838]|nr:COBW domain-containing protein 1 [Boothiomyces sp. JEL0838]